jgi:hypothetical protein
MSVERVNLVLDLPEPAECAPAKAQGHSRPLPDTGSGGSVKPTTQPSGSTARQRGDR